MLSKDEIKALANAQAKAYFQFMGEPTYTAKYQFEYPIFVERFIRDYTKRVNQEKRKQIKDNRNRT